MIPPVRTMAALCVSVLAGACAGLGGLTSAPESGATTSPSGPVVLAPTRVDTGAAPTAAAYVGSVDASEVAKAVERYRIQKRREPARYETGAADLNGDGRPEALVLFTGADWCLKTGCSLVVFQAQDFGFRPVSHIVSVRPPVLAAPPGGVGWRDLIVSTGGAGAPVRAVTLAFGANGYAANAIVQPPADTAIAARAEAVIRDTPSFQAALDELATRAPAIGETQPPSGLSHLDHTRKP
ncbi:MAG: hypothetical protein NW215_14310 [Hyphomicrobiales bacterium]|nr:hypothetical protein [Hyphomicrobiales bacterium]